MKRIASAHARSMAIQPCFIIGTRDAQGTANFAPITWASVTYNDDAKQFVLVISMNGAKKTKENLAATGVLSANVVNEDMVALVDFLGQRTGLEGPKLGMLYETGTGLTVDVPTLTASPMVYECVLDQSVTYGDTVTYFCPIKGVQLDENVDDTAHFPLNALRPVVYNGIDGGYHSLGEVLTR